MQKLTYENYSNGLSASFSTDSPQTLLTSFDGNSVGSTPIVYKPAEFDGDRFISANLDARTIAFTAEWYGVKDGRYSIKKSYEEWEQLQRVFVPGNMGKLTWTNGSASRFIECRTSELPNFTRTAGCKLSAEFKLVADYPYWQDAAEHTFNFLELEQFEHVMINNGCGIAVPFVFRCGGGIPFVIDYTAGAMIALDIPGGATGTFEVDTQRCVVTNDGEYCNQYLIPNSQFFKLVPGNNEITIAGWDYSGTLCEMKWHDHYLGVNC